MALKMDITYAFDAVRFAREALRWNPDEKQAEVLRSRKRRVILNWGRQSGKTTLAAAKMVQTAVVFPGALCVWMSANKEHTAEVFSKMESFLLELQIAAKGQPGKQMARVLPNGSRLLGLAARDATVRSYTAHLVVIDEGAQVADSVYDAVMPLLAVHHGVLWVLGTPRGKRGRFYEIWSRGDAQEWLKVIRKTADSGRVSRAFLESERRAKGESVMKREYECEFQDDGLGLFRSDDVQRIFQKNWKDDKEE
jgi:hypothetical protein